jgi:hypothetical protein
MKLITSKNLNQIQNNLGSHLNTLISQVKSNFEKNLKS